MLCYLQTSGTLTSIGDKSGTLDSADGRPRAEDGTTLSQPAAWWIEEERAKAKALDRVSGAEARKLSKEASSMACERQSWVTETSMSCKRTQSGLVVA